MSSFSHELDNLGLLDYNSATLKTMAACENNFQNPDTSLISEKEIGIRTVVSVERLDVADKDAVERYLNELLDPCNCPHYPGLYKRVSGVIKPKSVKEFQKDIDKPNIIPVVGKNEHGEELAWALVETSNSEDYDYGAILGKVVVKKEFQHGKTVRTGETFIDELAYWYLAERARVIEDPTQRMTSLYVTYATKVPNWWITQDFYHDMGFQVGLRTIQVKGLVHLGPDQKLTNEEGPAGHERLIPVPSLTGVIENLEAWNISRLQIRSTRNSRLKS